MNSRNLAALVAVLSGLFGACARTGLTSDIDTAINGSCVVVSDCEVVEPCRIPACVEGRCVDGGPVVCDESVDACFENACVESSGACEAVRRVKDADADGHYAPLPGFSPSDPAACGDDCDDTSAAARPGGLEVCDGRDNDCDGTIDNGGRYFGQASEDSLTLTEVGRLPNSGRRSVAGIDRGFALGYWVDSGDMHPYLRGMAPGGGELFPETLVTSANAPSFGATVVNAGVELGVAWTDARLDQNYEVYFARFDSLGVKLGPDIRVTTASGFSVHPELLFDQGRYALVFDDARGDEAQVFAQLISSEGTLIGANLQLTTGAVRSELPSIAASEKRFGVVYLVVNGTDQGVEFRSFDKDFGGAAEPRRLTSQSAKAPRVAALGRDFLVTWDEAFPDAAGSAIWGAVVDEKGNLLRSPQAITSGATHARSHSTLSLGDRFLLAWADDADGNYEVYGKVLDRNFAEIEPRTRLTWDAADSINPQLSLTDGGTLGVFFDDFRTGARQAYLATLGCFP